MMATFWGFTSRCAMSASCMLRRPVSMRRAMTRTVDSGSRRVWSRRSSVVPQASLRASRSALVVPVAVAVTKEGVQRVEILSAS